MAQQDTLHWTLKPVLWEDPHYCINLYRHYHPAINAASQEN